MMANEDGTSTMTLRFCIFLALLMERVASSNPPPHSNHHDAATTTPTKEDRPSRQYLRRAAIRQQHHLAEDESGVSKLQRRVDEVEQPEYHPTGRRRLAGEKWCK